MTFSPGRVHRLPGARHLLGRRRGLHWEAFRSSVTADITASACGITYWGWDLAGFSGPVPDSELAWERLGPVLAP